MRLALIAAAVLVAAGFGAAYAAGAFGGDSSSQAIRAPRGPPTGLSWRRSVGSCSRRRRRGATRTRGAPSSCRRPATSPSSSTSTRSSPTSLYFVLVDGEFDGGTLLAVTIEPRTDRLVDAGLVGAMPDLSAMGEPQLLRLYRR